MSRKPSLKTIHSAPAARVFSPSESNLSDTQGKIILLLEEWEALRLVDYMRLEQPVAALSMAISRQTVQMLLSSARTKLARAVVEGLPLRIQDNPKNTSKQHTPFMKRNTQMKIAVTTQHNQVFPHFGRTPEFSIVTAEDGKIVEENIIPAPAEGHGALIGFLVDQGVDVLICGGVGGGALNSLRASGIQVYAGASGHVKEQVLSLLSGQLPQQGDADCDHHGEHDHEHHHEHGHEGGDCGHHQG